ncbi:MAG: UDP-N-acetylmuramate dehydrogenase [Candidatus Omnitrophota bacterium]|nr:UDP-N-acetylmuramate dehydrogenase [Candidatus Omnitrophota bacterium]
MKQIKSYRGKLIENEPLSKHITLKVGGPARYMVFPRSSEEIKHIVVECLGKDIPFVMLGKGANVLADDKGFPGVVINTLQFNSYQFDGYTITADAGASMQQLCDVCLEHELGGLEFAFPIPGTIGGFVFMNTGWWPESKMFTSNVVEKVDVFDGVKMFSLSKEECMFRYRESIFHKHSNWAILSIKLILTVRSKTEIIQNTERFKGYTKGQDRAFPNAGSVFLGGNREYGGTFDDLPGIRGHTIGGAKFSEKTPNWIINFNNATSNDICALIKHAENVHRQTGKPKPTLEWRIFK